MKPIVLRPVVTDTLAVLFVLAAALAVILHTYGCTPPPPKVIQSAENAAAVAQYERLLDSCRLQGKDAGSYAVYEICADQVDSMLCRVNQLLCADGGPDAR